MSGPPRNIRDLFPRSLDDDDDEDEEEEDRPMSPEYPPDPPVPAPVLRQNLQTNFRLGPEEPTDQEVAAPAPVLRQHLQTAFRRPDAPPPAAGDDLRAAFSRMAESFASMRSENEEESGEPSEDPFTDYATSAHTSEGEQQRRETLFASRHMREAVAAGLQAAAPLPPPPGPPSASSSSDGGSSSHQRAASLRLPPARAGPAPTRAQLWSRAVARRRYDDEPLDTPMESDERDDDDEEDADDEKSLPRTDGNPVQAAEVVRQPPSFWSLTAARYQ